VRAVLALAMLLCVANTLGGCVTTPKGRSVSGFRLDVDPSDAELTVDGKELGPVNAVPLADGVLSLDPGVHQLSLQRKGYQTWRAEVSLGNQVEPLKVNLVKR
jgi:hypothetical protein